jgi:hypothetical protein
MSCRAQILARLTTAVATLALALGGGVATAEPFKACGSFGSPGSALGQFAGESPLGIGVDDATGAVYAFDDGPNTRVQRFAALGSCEYGEASQFTGTATPAGGFTEEDVGLAVDNSSGATKGDVYVSDTGHNVVDRFSAGGEYLGQIEIPSPDGVAVDGEGNVYVTTFADKDVHEFDDSGHEVGELTGSLLSGLLFGVAVDATGNVYVVNNSTNIVKLTVSGGTVTHEAVLDAHAPTAVATGSSGRLYALDTEGEPHVTVYTIQGKEIETFGGGEIGFSLALAFGPVSGGGGVFVADLAHDEVHVAEQGKVAVLPEPPELSSCHAAGITRTSAEAGCTINPNAAKAGWHLEYGEVGVATLTEVPGGEVTSTKAVSTALSGLEAGTEYVFKLIATNANGTSEEEGSFTTLPAVTGLTKCEAAEIEGTHVKLEAVLEPEGIATTLHFEYGLTTSYGNSTSTQESEQAGTLNAAAPVSELEGNATYHCRLVASNSFGATDGKDGVFATPLVEPLVDQPPSAEATRTSAVLSGTVNPENSPTQAHFEYVDAADYEAGAADPYSAGGSTPSFSVGAGFGQKPVGPQVIEGLQPATEYHYRLLASNQANSGEAPTLGADHVFTTAARAVPQASIGLATGIEQTGATLSAIVNPSGLPTVYQFEIETGLGFNLTSLSGSAGEGESPELVQGHVSGLAPGTMYAFRMTVRNADGQQTSSAQSFTTTVLLSPIFAPQAPTLLPIPTLDFPAPGVNSGHPLTRAQKLAKALKACQKKSKKKRPACKRQSHKRYGPIKSKAR